jgi:hypothetical protein
VKYQNGGAFRRALEQRLQSYSAKTGIPLVRLRKMVAFDRFLARLQPDQWVLKGGLALQLRLGNRARTTKDIDVLALLQASEITAALRKAGSTDLGDWFLFEVAEPSSLSTGIGGTRYTVQALLDGRIFEQFHIDVGIGDPIVDDVDYLTTPAMLDFADLQPTQFPCYPITQQIAEKLHAYTRPHKSGESSRVKDFVDILLLAELGAIDGSHLYKAIQATFSAMGTHPVPSSVSSPPPEWNRGIISIRKNLGIEDLTLAQAYEIIQAFLNPVLRGELVTQWDPTRRTWS